MHLIYFVCLTWRCTPNSSKKICFVRRLLSPRSDQATMTSHKMTMYSKKWLDPDFVTSLSSTKCRSHLVLLRSSIEFVAIRDCCTQMKNELETKTFTRIEKKKLQEMRFFVVVRIIFAFRWFLNRMKFRKRGAKPVFLSLQIFIFANLDLFRVFCASKFWILNWQLHNLFENKDGLMVRIDSWSTSDLCSNLATCSERV